MQNESSSGNTEEPPSPRWVDALKEFSPAGRGFWSNVPDSDWNDWHWQLKHRIMTLDQLQRLMPTLTPEEAAGTALANYKLALAITPYFFNLWIDPADNGAPSPKSPRNANSKSPFANPCKYSSGNNSPTSFVRRLNNGNTLLSNRFSVPRTRGLRTVIVPPCRDRCRRFP